MVWVAGGAREVHDGRFQAGVFESRKRLGGVQRAIGGDEIGGLR